MTTPRSLLVACHGNRRLLLLLLFSLTTLFFYLNVSDVFDIPANTTSASAHASINNVVKGDSNHAEEDTSDISDVSSYSYLIIHYHRTGHHLSHTLQSLIADHVKNSNTVDKINTIGTSGAIGNLKNVKIYPRENSFPRRSHDPTTLCPEIRLAPGVVGVQAAPNFFCGADVLRELLLRGVHKGNKGKKSNKGSGTTNGVKGTGRRGVKIVHVVREPFGMAVSNYNYHRQYPPPETWIKKVNPCIEELYPKSQKYSDLILPTVNSMNHPIYPILTQNDFHTLYKHCSTLYQTKPSFETKKYQGHLIHLPPEEGVQLATIHMMLQGVTGGDVLRMVNNLLKLREVVGLNSLNGNVENLENSAIGQVEVLTMSTDEFTSNPQISVHKVLNFMFGSALPPNVRGEMAHAYHANYEESMMEEVAIRESERIRAREEKTTGTNKGNNGDASQSVQSVPSEQSLQHVMHVTRNFENTENLKNFLRQHPLFGGILGRIEQVVNEALDESRHLYG